MYSSLNSPNTSYSNAVGHWTPIGLPDLSGIAVGTATNETETVSGTLINITITLYTPPNPYGVPAGCGGIFETALMTNDGDLNGLWNLISSQGQSTSGMYCSPTRLLMNTVKKSWKLFVSAFEYYSVLYTDYTNLVVHESCDNVNFLTGMCSEPQVVVQTRVRPTQLTEAQKAAINSQLDAVLAPYCLSSQQLISAPWNDTLSECDPMEPTEFVQLIQLLARFF